MSTVGRLIRETNDTLGLTSVIVTHNVAQMRKLVDFCFILASAKLIAEGSPQALMHNDDPAVRTGRRTDFIQIPERSG